MILTVMNVIRFSRISIVSTESRSNTTTFVVVLQTYIQTAVDWRWYFFRPPCDVEGDSEDTDDHVRMEQRPQNDSQKKSATARGPDGLFA